jgi:hypothetical protein
MYWAIGPSGSDPRLSGPRGRPASQGLRLFGLSLSCQRLHEEEKAELVKKDGGGRSTRPAGRVAWPPGLHLVLNSLLQVSGGPNHGYKYPHMVKVNTPHSICSTPLKKVLVYWW